jgi:tRNA-specific 2-thiouridylase
MKIALSLGADYVATGHYRKSQTEVNGVQFINYVLADNNRSYFLCQLSQEQLSKSLFPIGELTKPEVREIAAQMELVTAEKDSQGLCFIGKFTGIFTTKLQPIEGSIIQIDKMMAYMRFKSKRVVSERYCH